MPPKPSAQPTEKEKKEDQKAQNAEVAKEFKKDRPRILTKITAEHSKERDFQNLVNDENSLIEEIEKNIEDRTRENISTAKQLFKMIQECKATLKGLKTEIAQVEQSIQVAQEQYDKSSEEVINEYNIKKSIVIKENKEVEDQINHYTEWQRNSESFKAYLAELKSTIHHNRVICNEVIAENRQNAQAKIEKHRVDLAEALRRARAESLRLRPGDMSELSATFLTQSEQQVKSLNSQLESTGHLATVNKNIEEENANTMDEILQLQKSNEQLRLQVEQQKNVIEKLKSIQREFEERDKHDKMMKQIAKEKALMEKKRREEATKENIPESKPQFQMSQEQEAFLTFLNECATSVRSVLKQLLGEDSKSKVTPKDDKFEAPKLTAMVHEIKDMTLKLDANPISKLNCSKPILTPAAAYFAFSAPFDDSDEFIKSEKWSFAKYEGSKPQSNASSQKRPRIVRLKPGYKNPI